MAGIENLFAIEPTLPTVQGMKLPDNPERWSEVMTTHLREMYPDAAKLPIMVEFRKRNDQTGTAIGAMHVSSEDGKKVILVPFIIDDFEMKPLDVWMEKKKQAVHPLSKDTLKEQFFSTKAGELDARPGDSAGNYFNDPSLWTTNYPPLQGRYSYASAGYQLLDELSDTFQTADAERFKNVLREEPHLLVKFQKHGHQEIIEKLVKKAYANTKDYASSAMALIPKSVIDIKKNGQDTYSVLSMMDGTFDTLEAFKMNREALHKFVSKVCAEPQDVLNDLDQGGERTIIIRKPSDNVFLYDEMEIKPEEAKTYDCFVVKNKTGLTTEGVVLPNVVDFSGKKKNMKIFISPTHSAYQASIAGIPVKQSLAAQKVLKGCDANVGQTGTFVYIDDGKALATIPVTIKAIENNGWQMSCTDLEGKTFKVRMGYGNYFEKEEQEAPSNGLVSASGASAIKGAPKFKRTYLDAHGFIELRKDIYIIPEKMIWIPMQPFTDVTSTAAEYIQKEAYTRMDADPMEIRYTGVVFDIRTSEFKKEASERETRVILAAHGLSHEKIAAVIKRAKFHKKAKVHGADRLVSKAAKGGEIAKLITKISSACEALKKNNFIKEAAEVTDTKTVDALLSLNFLNPDNVAKFAAYKPVFEKVVDYLAELVLASRLGAKEVPEYAAVGAMTKLQDVITGLEKLEMSLKKPSTKST